MRGTGSHRQPRGCSGKRGGTGKWGGRKDERESGFDLGCHRRTLTPWIEPHLRASKLTLPPVQRVNQGSREQKRGRWPGGHCDVMTGGQRAGIREPERGAGGWKNPFLRRRPLGCQSDALLITKGHHGGHRVSAGTKYKPRLKPLL